MKRLRDEIDATDPAIARDAMRLRAVSPFQPAPWSRQRVRAALEQRTNARRAGIPRLSPVLVMMVLLGLATIAGATVGRPWVRALIERLRPAAAAPITPARPTTSTSRPPRGPITPPTLPTGAESAPSPPPPRPGARPAPALATGSSAERGVRVVAVPRETVAPSKEVVDSPPTVAVPTPHTPVPVAPPDPPPPVAPAASPDPVVAVERSDAGVLGNSIVVDAVNALRRDHDWERARDNLTFYLKLHPDGELVEEALALLIEVESAAGSERAVEAAVKRYLGRYPHGQYTARARSHLK